MLILAYLIINLLHYHCMATYTQGKLVRDKGYINGIASKECDGCNMAHCYNDKFPNKLLPWRLRTRTDVPALRGSVFVVLARRGLVCDRQGYLILRIDQTRPRDLFHPIHLTRKWLKWAFFSHLTPLTEIDESLYLVDYMSHRCMGVERMGEELYTLMSSVDLYAWHCR